MADNTDRFPQIRLINKPNEFVNATIRGRDNIVDKTAENIIVNGQNNYVGPNCRDINLLNTSGCTVSSGVVGVNLFSCSGVTVSENNVLYFNNKKVSTYGSIKYYAGTIVQSGTSAPTVTEVVNSFITPVTTSYAGVGLYNILCAEFIDGETTTMITTTYNAGNLFRIACISDGIVRIESLSGGYANSILQANFEIKVFT